MGENSKIEWTDNTFNPVRGCEKESPGCDNCYALALSKRNPATLGLWGPDGTRIIASESMWQAPVKWNAEAEKASQWADVERPRVFCASLADVFEAWDGPMSLPLQDVAGKWHAVTAWICADGQFRIEGERPAFYHDVRARLFALIEATPHLDWQLLTKRPQNVLRMVPASWRQKFPPNVWMGTTCEDQERANERIPHLLDIPARVRFLSCEPLLGPLSLEAMPLDPEDSLFRYWPLTGAHIRDGYNEPRTLNGCARIHWVIAGGESGPGARPMRTSWVRNLRDECAAAGVPFLFKQWGEWFPGCQYREGDLERLREKSQHSFNLDDHSWLVGKKAAGRLLDGIEHNGFPQITEGRTT